MRKIFRPSSHIKLKFSWRILNIRFEDLTLTNYPVKQVGRHFFPNLFIKMRFSQVFPLADINITKKALFFPLIFEFDRHSLKVFPRLFHNSSFGRYYFLTVLN